MLTTITVNGTEGLRFLSRLQEHSERSRRPVPPALVAMIEHLTAGQFPSATDALEHLRLEVTPTLAEEIAAFVATVSQGQDALSGPSWPLLFSAQLGDLVVLVRDVLAEMHVPRRAARTWMFLPEGTVGRLVSRKEDLGKLLLLDSPRSGSAGSHFPAREHAYVSERNTTRTEIPRA